jgi:hypothetical protein
MGAAVDEEAEGTESVLLLHDDDDDNVVTGWKLCDTTDSMDSATTTLVILLCKDTTKSIIAGKFWPCIVLLLEVKQGSASLKLKVRANCVLSLSLLRCVSL